MKKVKTYPWDVIGLVIGLLLAIFGVVASDKAFMVLGGRLIVNPMIVMISGFGIFFYTLGTPSEVEGYITIFRGPKSVFVAHAMLGFSLLTLAIGAYYYWPMAALMFGIGWFMGYIGKDVIEDSLQEEQEFRRWLAAKKAASTSN